MELENEGPGYDPQPHNLMLNHHLSNSTLYPRYNKASGCQGNQPWNSAGPQILFILHWARGGGYPWAEIRIRGTGWSLPELSCSHTYRGGWLSFLVVRTIWKASLGRSLWGHGSLGLPGATKFVVRTSTGVYTGQRLQPSLDFNWVRHCSPTELASHKRSCILTQKLWRWSFVSLWQLLLLAWPATIYTHSTGS